jgi:hypothetical protein
LCGISSPYRKLGILHARHQAFFGKDDDEVLVVQGETTMLNPSIDRGIIARAQADDPESALAEWSAQFRGDISSLLPDDVIDSAVDAARPRELPPRSEVDYVAFVDPSGGRHDSFCICIGHRTGVGEEAKFVADVVRGVAPPFDPKSVVTEFVKLARDYRCRKIVGDNYSAEWVSAAFREAGAEYVRSDLPKSQLYLESLPQWMRGAVSIPDHPQLIRELRLLERRTHRSGKDSVDHGTGGSDDYANSVVGAVWASRIGRRKPETKSYTTSLGLFAGELIEVSKTPQRGNVFSGRDYIAAEKAAGRWLKPPRRQAR